MIKEFIEKWNQYKGHLEKYFVTTNQAEYDTYEKIVKKIVQLIINKKLEDKYDLNNYTIIDDGDYQGTQIFIFHKNIYEPDISEYIYTSNYYGSCSGCDTLLRINEYQSGLPSAQQVKDYMTLSLHIIQNFRKMEEEK